MERSPTEAAYLLGGSVLKNWFPNLNRFHFSDGRGWGSGGKSVGHGLGHAATDGLFQFGVG